MTKSTVLMDSWDEIEAAAEPIMRARAARKANPWVRDIIRILMGSDSGLHIENIEKELLVCRDVNLNIPKKFRQTLQSCLNQHTSQSFVFLRKGSSDTEDLFFSPSGKGTGVWAIRSLARCTAWLEDRGLDPV